MNSPQAAELDVAIMTVNRPRNYLPQTLASLFASGPEVWRFTPFHLFVGNDDLRHLASLRHHAGLAIHELPPADWQRIAPWHVHHRLTFNLWRCLAHPCDAKWGRCICEDDIVVRDGFFSKLLATVEETREREGPYFVLAIYSPYDFASEPGRMRGRFHCSYNASQHYGNCCFFVSADLLPILARLFYARGVEQDEAPADILLGRFCEELWQGGKGGMYQAVASLAQHKGVVSGGTSGGYAYSPTFDHPWPAGD